MYQGIDQSPQAHVQKVPWRMRLMHSGIKTPDAKREIH